jgi:uncharacterized membrane protein YtjA (UPF0391 family)
MLSWSITFLVVGLIAGILGLSGIAGAATQIAWFSLVKIVEAPPVVAQKTGQPRHSIDNILQGRI